MVVNSVVLEIRTTECGQGLRVLRPVESKLSGVETLDIRSFMFIGCSHFLRDMSNQVFEPFKIRKEYM